MQDLDVISQFFNAIANDGRISSTHIGVYAALVMYWKKNGCENPLTAYSYQIMEIAKISSPTTFHKCIRELDDYGYIIYQPSLKKNRASKVFLIKDDAG